MPPIVSRDAPQRAPISELGDARAQLAAARGVTRMASPGASVPGVAHDPRALAIPAHRVAAAQHGQRAQAVEPSGGVAEAGPGRGAAAARPRRRAGRPARAAPRCTRPAGGADRTGPSARSRRVEAAAAARRRRRARRAAARPASSPRCRARHASRPGKPAQSRPRQQRVQADFVAPQPAGDGAREAAARAA